jgi:tetratricopeptide (TPR) repeat protein
VEVARRVAAVEAALGSEDLAGARAALARLAEVAPEHAQLAALKGRLEEAEARASRRERLTAMTASIRELLGRNDVEAAGRAVEEAIALDGADGEARALRDLVRARRAENERAQRAAHERKVAQARARLTSGDLAGAIEGLEAVLAEDPSQTAAGKELTEAKSRRGALETQEAAVARKVALEARVVEARLRLSEGDLAGAIERFESVLRDDGSHAEAQRGLGEARQRRTALEAQEATAARQAALDARVAEGRLRLAEGDLLGAIDQFEGVLADDQGHADARRALAEARQQLERLEGRVAGAAKRSALDARVAAGRLRLSAGDVAGAIERFQGVLTEDESHADARRELAEARQRLGTIDERVTATTRQSTLDAQVAEARARLAAGDPTGAIERLEAVLRDDGGHADARAALEQARGQRAAREAEETEAARRAGLDARVSDAQARLAAGDLVGAVESFEAVLRDSPKYEEAQRGLAEAGERRAALQGRVAEAHSRLTAGDVAAAIERLEAVLRDDPAHASAHQGLLGARRQQAAQQAREKEVATAMAALEKTLGGPDMDAVEAAFTWLVDLAPQHPQIASLRKRITEHRERLEEDREQLVREAIADAGRLLRDAQLERALEALARVRSLAPEHPDLAKLERQVQRLEATRGERVVALVASANSAIEKGELDAAQRAVQEALGIEPRHPDALAVQASIQSRGREFAETRVAELVAAGEAALAKDDFAAAEATVAKLRDLAPEHPEVASLGERVRTRRQKVEPQLIVRTALEEAARLIRDGRPERVPEVLARVRAVNPQHPEVPKLEAQAKKVAAAREVRVRVRGLADQARKLQVKGEFKEALRLAEEAVTLAPDDAGVLRLRDDLEEQVQKARRGR